MSLQAAFGYFATTLAPLVSMLVSKVAGEDIGVQAGIATGGAIALIGAIVLHRQQPPAGKP